MANSIYDIPTWTSGGIYYKKNDIVKYNGYFYYAKIDNTSASVVLTNPAIKGEWWHGVGASPYDGSVKQEFIWKPSYQAKSNHEPSVRTINFDGGYSQRMKSDIYNDLLAFDLSFNNRDIDEVTAIIHFLSNLGGADSFVWIPAPPYAKAKLFYCDTWDSSEEFHNNFNLSATFKETNA